MNLYLINILLIFLNLFNSFAQQDSIQKFMLSPDYKFEDGIFLNFEQVKANNPIPKSRIHISESYDSPNFFDKLTENNSISFFDDLGSKHDIPTKKIWGYSKNGVLYIAINDNFFRITYLGSICHFVAALTTYGQNNTTYPYYNYNTMPYTRTSSPSAEIRQYLFSFETGKILPYNEESVVLLLMKDPVLYDEYMNLKNKKKKQLKFLYLRKFNENNPIYLPK